MYARKLEIKKKKKITAKSYGREPRKHNLASRLGLKKSS